jgi:hypothetical protein
MLPPEESAPQEPRRSVHHHVDPDSDEQMGGINVIYVGSMSIASKIQG